MVKENKTTETKSNKDSQKRSKLTTVDQRGDLFSPYGFDSVPIGDSVQTQAAKLSDPRLQTVQRQTMAERVGQVQGNQHLQRVTSAVAGAHNSRRHPEQRSLLPIPDFPNAPVQLLRSGNVEGIRYDENPQDVIAIRMSFQIGDFNTILANINRVVQQFGSSRRTYTRDMNFQLMLRSFLQEIGHPSVTGGGPVMTRQRWLRLRIRLVRGEGRRINRLQLLRPRQEITVETPEVVEPRERPEQVPVERPTPAVEEQTPTAEQAPAEEQGILSSIASGAESLGNLASARWMWDPITSQMAEWEAELDRIGERGAPDTLGSILLVPVSLLFVILQAIVGSLDLIARLNPLSVALHINARQVRAIAGQYTHEDFMRDALEVGDEALNIITLGLRNAFRHLQEGIEEANAFRITQAVGEILLAALAIFAIFRSIRARSSAGRMSAAVAEESRTPAGRASAPTEPASEEVRPSAPTELAPEVRTPGRRTGEAQIGLQVEQFFTTEEVARIVRDEYVSGQARGGYIESVRHQSFLDHWYETGGQGRPPLAFIDSAGTLVYDATRIGRAPPDLVRAGTLRRLARRPLPPIPAAIVNVEMARQIIQVHVQRGGPIFRQTAQVFQRSWQRAGGSPEPTPVAFMNNDGVLYVNREALTGQ